MFGNWWFRKEKPLPGLMGLGGGATSLTLGGAAPFTATGANAPNCPEDGLDPAPTSPTGWIYHTFTGPGTFSIGSAMTGWKILAGGGGGGGEAQRFCISKFPRIFMAVARTLIGGAPEQAGLASAGT